MGEYQSRGPTHAGPSFASAGAAPRGPEPTPQDRARDAVGLARHQGKLVHDAAARLAAAHACNDLTRWKEARKELDRALVNATRRFEQTRTQLGSATPEVATAFEAATRELAQDQESAHAAE